MVVAIAVAEVTFCGAGVHVVGEENVCRVVCMVLALGEVGDMATLHTRGRVV
jgi:hypothetical protein